MKDLKKLNVFAWMVLIILSLYVILACIIYFSFDPPTNAGIFGDMFGGITALFGSLTFAGVLYTIYLQRKELRLTRKELKLTRKEFKIQNRTTNQQRFENTFFKMLESLSKSRYYYHDKLIDFKKVLDEQNKVFYASAESKEPIPYDKDNHQTLLNYYLNLSDNNRYDIKKYYTQVDNIITLIFDSDLSSPKIEFYIRILKSYIDDEHELALVFYMLGFRYSLDHPVRNQIRKSRLFFDLNRLLLVHITYNNLFFAFEDIPPENI